MAKHSDYKIKSYYTALHPNTEKFKITLGVDTLAIRKTFEEATLLVANLENDPWFLDRGYTRSDRCKT
jgi:hypothetical protein